VPVMSDEVLLDWLRAAAPGCRWTASVCTGAGLYAAAGLLEGKWTTTHWGFRDNIRALGVEVVADRVVWQGNHVSGAGVSAGIDMALSLTERVHGRELAESLQLVIEYDPQPPFDSGSPTRADASTLRLALRALLGDRPLRMAAGMNGQAVAARFGRARRALSGRLWSKRKRAPAGHRAPAASEGNHMSTIRDQFPTEVAGLPEALPAQLVELADGDEFDLRIAPVAKRLGEATVRMLAYNGSIPGPILKLREGSEVVVNIENEGDIETTVHWHGLRLDNRYDGTHHTQHPIAVGEKFRARVTFPDPGAYWYHPHIREDYGQEMGLYGNILVEPIDPNYWPPVDREVVLTLDDILLEEGRVAPFSRVETRYSAMGRYGDVLLVSGETDLALSAQLGEVVRFYLTNTANTRVFKVLLPGTRMKLVGGDSGHVEHEQFVDSVVVAPSERVVVDVLFDQAGELALEHHTPARVYPLASINVSAKRTEPSLDNKFEVLRTNADMVAERERIAPYVDAQPDKILAFIAEMDMPAPEGDGPVVYSCPMHPDVVSEEAGHCPECGMKLLAVEAPATMYACPMHPEVVSEDQGHCPECGMKLLPAQVVAEAGHGHEHEGHGQEREAQEHEHRAPEHGHEGHVPGHEVHAHSTAGGIEWEDDMVEINRMTTPANMRWKVVDRATGAENTAIDWRLRVGDQVKIRLVNEMAGDHPMHHPFHVHGAGRVLVLSRDGVVEPNLVWKDTVLVRTGETVDILLDVSNPGHWMAHCHIAEHHESGMMFSFIVDE
jgi:FtsP/CotA-like multicopper oxidase with cupredoxin domain